MTKQLERWLPFMRQQLKHLELFRTNVGKNILVSYNDKIIQFTIKSKFSTCIYCSNFLSIIEMDSLLLILCWVCHKQNILSFNKTNQLNIMICFKDRSQIVSKWDPLQWYFIWCIISKYRHKLMKMNNIELWDSSIIHLTWCDPINGNWIAWYNDICGLLRNYTSTARSGIPELKCYRCTFCLTELSAILGRCNKTQKLNVIFHRLSTHAVVANSFYCYFYCFNIWDLSLDLKQHF